MTITYPAILSFILLVGGTSTSMSGQTIQGKSQDGRVISCGLHISGDTVHTVQPFLETTQAVPGTLDLVVEAISGSNRNMTMQKTSLSSLPVVKVSGDHLNVRMTMQSGGQIVCELNEKVDFGPIDI